MGPRVAVVGSGAWGTTLSIVIGRSEPVVLLSHSGETAALLASTRRNERRLPGVELPDQILVTADPSALATAIDLVVIAVPSAHVRETLERVRSHIPRSAASW